MHGDGIEWIILVVAILMVVSVMARSLASRFGLPALLGFLFLGMAAGSEGVGGISFKDVGIAKEAGVIALVLILYAGGLGVRTAGLRRVLMPAAVLATFGVVLSTMIVSFVGVAVYNWTLLEGALFGAIISSTDAAAVFASLKADRLNLEEKVETLIELESGSNDPTAVFLVGAAIVLTEAPDTPVAAFFLGYGIEMTIGLAVGVGVGLGFAFLMQRTPAGQPHPFVVLSLAAPLAAFGLAGTVSGNGFLAAFIAGLAVAHRNFDYKEAVVGFMGAAAWLGQVAMFLVLGLLVFPSSLLSAAPVGLLMTAVLLFVARPISVFLCLLPFASFDWKAKLFISWAGLRGAVPIVLAMFPMLAGVEGSAAMFNTVFFVVLLSSVVQGRTLGWLARRLGLSRIEATGANSAT